MPAPIAKGVIIVAAVLIAAGYAVYENREHVKEFMNRSKQKITLAMHSFADEYMTSDEERERRRRRSSASAEELRERPRRTTTDDYDEKALEATGRDNWPGDSVYRHRPAMNRSMVDDGEPVRNPFGDENKVLYESKHQHFMAPSESSATLSADDHLDEKAPELPPRPGSDRRSSVVSSEKHGSPMPPILFSADAVDAATHPHNHSSTAPVVAAAAAVAAPAVAIAAVSAPAFVAAPPVSSPPAVTDSRPTTAAAEMEQSSPDLLTQQYRQAQQFWSINEWSHEVADADEDRSDVQSQSSLGNDISVIGSEVDDDDVDHRVEAASDMASSVAGSWSDVGSEVSADDHVPHRR